MSDNGSGIEPDDLPLTVLRHATSKITTAEDLAHIGTLGFRGEALAAIAAVCKLRILSKTADTEMGSSMECDGGEIVNVVETGCAGGTTVIASELFYNVPARRKFLKKDATEGAAVTALVEKIALSCPHVAVKYIIDGDVRFMTSGDGDLKGTIYSVFGREMASRMSPVDRTDSRGIRIHGYIGDRTWYGPIKITRFSLLMEDMSNAERPWLDWSRRIYPIFPCRNFLCVFSIWT